MAMSCPVLVARVGGMDEILRFGGGITYPPGDVKSLCDSMMPLVASADVRKTLGAQARRAAEEHFSFDRMLNDFSTSVLDAG
jgi:glycosyltransferase involved in cell wall biosynthesis